jgi:hypothetical protein
LNSSSLDYTSNQQAGHLFEYASVQHGDELINASDAELPPVETSACLQPVCEADNVDASHPLNRLALLVLNEGSTAPHQTKIRNRHLHWKVKSYLISLMPRFQLAPVPTTTMIMLQGSM